MSVNEERKALERDVTSALLAKGYVKAKDRKFLKRIGQGTDVFVYPGVGSRNTIIELQPVVGFESSARASLSMTLWRKLSTCLSGISHPSKIVI
ncbi:MAG: hypothetical protein ACOZAM_28835 [Pseudomonadota bacterium]